MPRQKPRPPEDPGRPTPREAIAKVRSEAGPKVAKAMEAAAPKAQKAAVRAGKVLGTLANRAKDTAKGFSEGYSGEAGDPPEASADGKKPGRRPKPGPR